MTVTIVLVAATLVAISMFPLFSEFSCIPISVLSCTPIAVIVIAAIGCDDTTGGDEKKSGQGPVPGNAFQHAHRSLQSVGGY
jgi:hypothetical protein